MRRYHKIAIFGLLAAIPMLLAASGGFPSRPIFQQVTVGTGGAVLTNSGTGLLVNGQPAASFAWGRVNSSGTLLSSSSNVTSTSRTVAGVFVVNLASAFNTCIPAAQGTTVAFGKIGTVGAGPYTTIGIDFYAPNTATLVDPQTWVFYCFK